MPVDLLRCESGFPEGSRFLDGHFPGNPIVPGAIILGRLAAWLLATGRGLARVERMKFLRPLRPGTPFEIRLLPGGPAARVEFRDADGLFASARIVLRPSPVDD